MLSYSETRTQIQKTQMSTSEQTNRPIGFRAVLKPPGELLLRSCYCSQIPGFFYVFSFFWNRQAHFCPQGLLLLVWLKAHREKKHQNQRNNEEDTLLYATRFQK